MATITGLTAERMLEIEAASVVDGDVVGDNLFLQKHDGTLINAGSVRGPIGPSGPMGSSLAVITAQPVLDVGMINQIRAGRQLTPADFTNMGLSAPLGLWNLGSLADSSGNGRNLSNKGAVPFGVGILGAAASAAVFSGSSGQALYIPDVGAADPFRIKGGTFGCWMRCAKKATLQGILTKYDDTVAGRRAWHLGVGGTSSAAVTLSNDGSIAQAFSVTGATDVCDDRWHFIVGTYDVGVMKIYIDSNLENFATGAPVNVPIFGTPAPLNIGGYNADAATAATQPFYGRVSNAFVTNEVLSDEQIRNLYCASVPHALGVAPAQVSMKVRRKRRGSPLAVSDFPSQPVRLHNFQNGALTDQGSNNVPVSNLSPALILTSTGPDGVKDQAWHFAGAHLGLGSTDAGLPSGLNPRSYGIWFKSEQSTGVPGLIGWGAGGSSGAGAVLGLTSGSLYTQSGASAAITGPYVADGLWHFAVCVEENAPGDGLKQKVYLDAQLVLAGTPLSSIVLGGPNRFRMGNYPDSAVAFIGQLSRGFVTSSVLTVEQVRALYNVGLQQLAPSPKSAADHLETIEAARMLTVFDSLETCDLVDLAVLA